MKVTLALACVVVGGGCSLIYNENNIGVPSDAPPIPDSPPPIDAPPDPTMLAVDGVFPSSVFAGEGSGNSRPAVLAIHGSNFTSDATVAFDNDQVHVVGMQVAGDSSWIAVQLEIDAIAGSGSAGSGSDAGSGSAGSGSAGSASAGCGSAFDGVPVAITISETGASPATLPCVLALQEAPALVAGSGSAVTLDVATLGATTYSLIDLSRAASVTITDTGRTNAPIVFQSYSSIALPAITEIGANGSGTSAGGGAQGGCAGGSGEMNGGCSTPLGGGNGATTASGGGGGGGFATVGGNANGGLAHGSDDLVALTTNQSAGGGGGTGSILVTSPQPAGGGGGGGGTILVLADGAITVGGIDVSGGGGTPGSNVGIASAGGGGGGTGGVIILRSAASTVALGSGAKLYSDGGAGGAGNGGSPGGAGSPGRVRIDMQGGAIPMVSTRIGTSPSFHRGPVFSTTTNAIVTSPTASVSLLGQNRDVLVFYDVDGSGHVQVAGEPTLTFDSSNMGSASVALSAGYNHLCGTLNEGTAGSDLADTCMDLVYLP